MQRDLVLTAVFFGVLVVVLDVDGKMCPSLDIRNNVESLEKLRNCTIIMGYLQVVLLDRVPHHDVFANHSFPELEEIGEYLLVFQMSKLRNLGTIFPNLKVIRGNKLFSNYALVLNRMPHLQEIGLTNLRFIGRGGINIDYCPNLCFGDTVDWKAIGASTLHYRKTTHNDEYCASKFCPDECPGHCWDSVNCQKLHVPDKCHPQCIGCTKEHSPKNCHICKYFHHDGECVESCPISKVSNYYLMRCITAEQCRTMMNNTWWVFNNTCIHECPLYYKKDEKSEGGCVYVGDNYTRHCNGTNKASGTNESVIDSVPMLEKYAACTHIDGSLDIRITETFLESQLEINLGNIVSISGSLRVGRSGAIRSLEFFKSLRMIEGESLENQKYALFVYENQNLQRLWNFTNNFNLTIKRGTIAFHDNPQLCLSEIEKLANLTGTANISDIDVPKYSNGYNAICNTKDVHVTIIEKNPTNVVLSWKWPEDPNNSIIGFTIHYVSAMKGNVTTFENNDGCDSESWDSVFVRNSIAQLKSLEPYTRYGYYIKALSTSLESEQTPIYYFNTSSANPSELMDFIAEAKNESTIVLKWLPPKVTNGKLAYYYITIYLQEDYISTIEQRDYCRHPYRYSGKGGQSLMYSRPNTNTAILDCPCLSKNTNSFFRPDQVCEADDTCKKFLYYSISDKPADDNHTTIETISVQKKNLMEVATFTHTIKEGANESSYEFTNLRHFTVYVFYLSACNEREGDREQCSSPEMVFQRTNKSESADNVKTFSLTVNEKVVDIEWSDPKKVNSVIVSYQVEIKRTDLEHSKPTDECITRKEYQKIHYKYQLVGLAPGKYAVRVRATSLAGPGKFSAWKPFEISPPKAGMYWIYTLVGIVAFTFLALMAYIGRYWYRKKYAFNSNHLITSINPDYAGPIYEEDEWEIDRKDIEIIKELGQGSFGMVYQGMIKSKRYPCAIKTVNESASMPSRMEFLNEGAVMKTFDTPHVIRLLGIVSRGQPPLVVMELMERGDLKSYLRRCREPSQNLTTNEMYRMAAEIADGMAYLSAKKFVHRDLAARNCMVAADRTVKIGDFGMARDIYETDYYRKETVGLLPVRWMAPESLADGVFTSDSDVWSYGIVLWEMATLAEQPYQGLSNEEVFHFVKNKGKLDRPPECSDLLYEIMDACWVWRPNDRPTFADIVDKLVNHVGQDFRLVAFCYSQQGRELALNSGPRAYNPPAMIVVPDEDFFGRYDASEEEVSLYVKEPYAKEKNRPSKFLPLTNQRYNNKSSPYQTNPGSPSSTFSHNSS